MFELTLLTILVTIVVLAIRRGKPVVLENPLIINRIGKYHATLAPQLNQTQGLVEQIYRQFAASAATAGETDALSYQVHDARVCCNEDKFYLLAVSLRRGVLYFQAIMPQPLIRDADSHLSTLQSFADQVMRELPPPANTAARPLIDQAVRSAAAAMSIHITSL